MRPTREPRQREAGAPWPVVPASRNRLNAADGERVDSLARRLLAEDPALAAETSLRGSIDGRVASGWSPGPTLFYEDHKAVELTPEESLGRYEYRSLGLAGSGDFYLLARARVPAFERYLNETVGLGAPTILQVERPGPRQAGPLGAAGRSSGHAMDALVEAARARGGLNLLPYLSTGHAWLLADAVARRSGVPVRVAGPGPRLARRANDKLWFARAARRLLGREATPPTFAAYGPAGAAARVARLARRHDKVIVKLPASAGAMGNLALSGVALRQLSLAAIRLRLLSALRHLGWRERFPILIGVWETAVLDSPSAQVWVPLPGQGPPVLEGFFVQSLEGSGGEFVGAISTGLPGVSERFGRETLMLASLFQRLGYFGRLSLDAILLGETPQSARIHWIECNARWGGVSIPVTVANRLGLGGGSLAVVQRLGERVASLDFAETIRRLGTGLYRAGGPRRGAVLLQPTGLGERALTFFVAAPRADEAVRETRAALDDLGVSSG